MDDIKSGHPRTLGMHQEMQMRNVLRQQAQQTAQVVSREGFNVAMVTAVNAIGHVQLEGFTMEDGDGTWFAVLNHVTPQPGEMVIYGYVKGVPMVFGVMPSEETTPWRGPRSGLPDTFTFDDFEMGSHTGANMPGALKWTYANHASSSQMLIAGTADHPGVWQMGTNAVIAEWCYMHLNPGTLMLYESLTEVEFMVFTSLAAGILCDVGLNDHGVNFTNAIWARVDTTTIGTLQWTAMKSVAGVVTQVGDIGVTLVNNHWYKVNLKRLFPGVWRITVTDVTDPLNPISGEMEVTGTSLTAAGSPYVRMWNRTAAGRAFWTDYIWWSRLGLARGGR